MNDEISKSFTLTSRDSYISIVGFKDPWKYVKVNFLGLQSRLSLPPISIDINEIHDQFINDMKEFAIKWQPQHTEELLMILPKYSLIEPCFLSAESVAKNSLLTQQFSPIVIVLRTLFLQHFNYIRERHIKEIPIYLLFNLISFVSCEDAINEVFKKIICGNPKDFPTVKIRRQAAQRLVLEGKGNPSNSIIFQLTKELSKVDNNLLQCQWRPWKVKFDGEKAIDAGGPTRELMTEASNSIFNPTTKLFIISPNGRRKNGENQDYYIPYCTNEEYLIHYETIGILIGIILRCGLAQDLPFAPFIWKYLVRQKIIESDILCLDNVLKDQIFDIRNQIQNDNFKENELQWKCEDWNGKIIILPGHNSTQYVKKNEAIQYIEEMISFRISSFTPMLKRMRKAFNKNVGFKSHPLLTPSLLSRMAQGTSIVTTKHLSSITVITDYNDFQDPVIVRFWNAVDRLTNDERKLLLKFITTSTRLPNTSLRPNFKIQIDRLNTKGNPDQLLPTASTCFNKLHLPSYSSEEICYQKLLYAIKNCQTMDNR
ncbi:putative E3 ubiquitin-protein ligase HERC1 [Histomonas meleagridis]|uniref:putative E3 ubiquitin-protein ligase HERC1 n=1 Tax=Histomonas meleagridis TaxID=135588 RepID=UPI00355A1F51|nr:putative E3 ubiquitin-protein ligase HERC1 [Histomonas meleagridis]KAH0797747.1 putative E3 ubiquitin-protein ligase HERC1 [Histomonas meleagridis]